MKQMIKKISELKIQKNILEILMDYFILKQTININIDLYFKNQIIKFINKFLKLINTTYFI